MNTTDEILASRRYTDRRGRDWRYDTKHRFWLATPGFVAGWKVSDFGGPIDGDQMRLLIERDQHRDECVGIDSCEDHPVYFVQVYNGFPKTRFVVYGPHMFDDEQAYFHTLVDAMEAARALAVNP